MTWLSGSQQIVDLAPEIFRFKLYAPLRDDPDLFRSVHIEAWGSQIAWGDGAISMPAVSVEALAAQAMTPADLKAFLARHKLTLDAAAAQHGVSRRQAAYYAADKAVPRTVALACAYFDAKGQVEFGPFAVSKMSHTVCIQSLSTIVYTVKSRRPVVNPKIDEKRASFQEICQQFRVARLDVFCSAARGFDFEMDTSDVDFLVDFEPPDVDLSRFLEFQYALDALMGRPVDLLDRNTVEESRNYIRRRLILRGAEPIYAA